jgi:hypothetical protein
MCEQEIAGSIGPALPGYPPVTAAPWFSGNLSFPPAAGNLPTSPYPKCGGGDATAVFGPGSARGVSAGLPGGNAREIPR